MRGSQPQQAAATPSQKETHVVRVSTSKDGKFQRAKTIVQHYNLSKPEETWLTNPQLEARGIHSLHDQSVSGDTSK